MSHADESSAAIAWREWDEAAFEAARSEGKPVLLTLGATWCHWCHVMDEQAYADPRVIDLVTTRFIPVRVDVDRRPDIALRYNQGGYPSVAFLTGEGEFLAGRPYTPPDEMAALLRQVSGGELPAEQDSATAGRQAAGPTEKGATGDAVLERLTELYDEEFGGFGLEPKQPPWEALHFLTARYGLTGDRAILAMVETTLEGMWHGIYDRRDQGFFRYAVSRDWKVPHYEKMLVSNASLLVSYLEAYQVTGKTSHRVVAEGILRYLTQTLFDVEEGLFFASQDADEPYYQMSWKGREAASPPPIDRTFYAGWNALAALALVRAGGALGRQNYSRLGADILDRLWTESRSSAGALARRAGEAEGAAEGATAILGDQVNFLRGWLELYQATGMPENLRKASEVADSIQRLFGAPGGGCYDTVQTNSSGSFEYGLLPREQPVLENSHWAESLMVLAELTGDGKHSGRTAATLEAFESVIPGKSYLGDHASRRMEEDEEVLFLPAGSAWGRAKNMQDHGAVRLALVGDSTTAGYRGLHRAALRIYAPHRVVLPLDLERDGARIRDLGFPLNTEAALYICMGDRCLAPVTTPREARALARSRPWAGAQGGAARYR